MLVVVPVGGPFFRTFAFSDQSDDRIGASGIDTKNLNRFPVPCLVLFTHFDFHYTCSINLALARRSALAHPFLRALARATMALSLFSIARATALRDALLSLSLLM
jgi:hypothetical protein